jgi:hypothetical protein
VKLGGLAVLTATLLASQPAAAQTAVEWQLFHLRAGFCIQFLVSPDDLPRTPFARLNPVPASSAALGPVLARTVSQADSLADWYPTELCLFQADSSRTGNDTQHHRDRPVSIVLWRAGGRDDGELVPAVLFATEGKLLGAGDLAGSAEVGRMEASLDVDSETGQRLSIARIDRTQVALDGTLLADTLSNTPQTEHLTLAGKGPLWTVDVLLAPGVRRRLAGSLQVSGDGLLAELIRSSPVSWVGEYWTGGEVQFQFRRSL